MVAHHFSLLLLTEINNGCYHCTFFNINVMHIHYYSHSIVSRLMYVWCMTMYWCCLILTFILFAFVETVLESLVISSWPGHHDLTTCCLLTHRVKQRSFKINELEQKVLSKVHYFQNVCKCSSVNEFTTKPLLTVYSFSPIRRSTTCRFWAWSSRTRASTSVWLKTTQATSSPALSSSSWITVRHSTLTLALYLSTV